MIRSTLRAFAPTNTVGIQTGDLRQGMAPTRRKSHRICFAATKNCGKQRRFTPP